MNPWPVEAEVEESHLPRPGPRRPGRRAEVRPLATSATCSSAPRARETAARVAAGALAKEFLRALGVSVHSHVLRIASVARARARRPRPRGLRRRRRVAGALPRSRGRERDGRGDRPAAKGRTRASAGSSRCAPSASSPGSARTSPGTSSLDGRLAQAVVSIQAVKGVSIGEAWEVAAAPGLRVPRRDLLVRGARLPPRDQPRRRGRGRDVERRAARRPRRAEADLDPDQAAALGRHRDQGAGAGDARAHRLDRGPGRRRRRRGDGRAGARPLLSREVRRRPHRRRSRRRARRTGSGSIGGARAATPSTALARLHRLHGRGQVEGARARRRAPPGSRRSTPTSCSSASSAARSTSSSPRGRGRVPPPRGGVRRRAARRAPAARAIALGGGSVLSERCARRSPATPSSGSRSTRRPPGSGSRARSGRWPTDRDASSALLAEREPIYESLADAVVPGRRRRAVAGARRAARARELPAGTRLAWATSALGRLPGLRRRAGCSASGFWPLGGPRGFCDHRHDRRRPLRERDRPRSRATVAVGARRAGEDASPRPSGCCASSPRSGATRSDHVVAARRRRGRRPGRASAPPLYQRGVAGGPGADDARRPGRLRLRRQDRRRPAARRRTTSAPTTCRPRCSPTRRRSRRCRARSSPPASPRW